MGLGDARTSGLGDTWGLEDMGHNYGLEDMINKQHLSFVLNLQFAIYNLQFSVVKRKVLYNGDFQRP